MVMTVMTVMTEILCSVSWSVVQRKPFVPQIFFFFFRSRQGNVMCSPQTL